MYIILYLLGVFAATEICGYKWYPPCLSMSYDALRRPVRKSSSHGGQKWSRRRSTGHRPILSSRSWDKQRSGKALWDRWLV